MISAGPAPSIWTLIHWYNTMHFGRQTIWQRKTNAHLMTDYALKFAEAAERNSTIDDVHKPWERSHAMYQSLGPVLASHDVFICPTNNLAAVKADHDPWDQAFHRQRQEGRSGIWLGHDGTSSTCCTIARCWPCPQATQRKAFPPAFKSSAAPGMMPASSAPDWLTKKPLAAGTPAKEKRPVINN